ncbi:MAG: zinc dependent phospholipase C family protein [Anaerolineales bacterium]|nr:zinc dependent phospholipase C family protein [Anaerolineales bacterium]
MPTPFMHLHIAEKTVNAFAIEHSDNRVLGQIRAAWPAFYFGSVAPDYQTICDVPREDTHFYHMPPEQGNMGYNRMLKTYPQLADARVLTSPHAVFIAAYAAHLLLDMIWLREILYPIFLNSSHFEDRHERHLTHLILLTYLDGLAYNTLSATAGTTLAAAVPDHWLPFALDADLIRWQTLLTRQLLPGGQRETEAIFAERLGLTTEAFGALLADENWLQTHLLKKIPIDSIQARLDTAVSESVTIIQNYLNPT